jgi:hypothetical protein
MFDFYKYFFVLVVLVCLLITSMSLDRSVTALEDQVYEVCVTTQWLLKNRPTPAIHSYNRDLPVCQHRR